MVFTLLPIFVPITPTLSLLSCMSSPVPCYPSCEFTMVFLPHISVSYLFSHIGSLFTWILQQFFGRLPHLSGLFVVFLQKVSSFGRYSMDVFNSALHHHSKITQYGNVCWKMYPSNARKLWWCNTLLSVQHITHSYLMPHLSMTHTFLHMPRVRSQ